MKLIPPTIADLANSKKAVTFWVLIGLWLPMTRQLTELTDSQLQWLTLGYMAYAIAQGLKDLGLALHNGESKTDSAKG